MPPVMLSAPDLTSHRDGTTGIPWVHSVAARRDGPHVMVTALVHGNELCGAIVLDEVLRTGLRPSAGRLTLAFVNMDAFQRFDPTRPAASRFVDEDFNRLWSAAVLDGPHASHEATRARALRPIIDTVDLLLDIHSMQYGSPPLILAGPLAKGRALARRVGAPALVVSDVGHAAGTRLRDYGAFADPASPRAALLVECGQHWDPAAVPVAREVTWRFLRAAGVIEPEQAEAMLSPVPTPPRQRFIQVTDTITPTTSRFTFAQPFTGQEVLGPKGSLIGHDGDRAVVTPYDECVLIMPARPPVRRGQTAVRLGRYVDPDTTHPVPPSAP